MWPQWEYDADNQVHPYLGSAGLRGAIVIDEALMKLFQDQVDTVDTVYKSGLYRTFM